MFFQIHCPQRMKATEFADFSDFLLECDHKDDILGFLFFASDIFH